MSAEQLPVFPCATCALKEWEDFLRDGWWVQHGDNPEHRRLFMRLAAIELEPPYVTALSPVWNYKAFQYRRDVFEWLEACHGGRRELSV